MATAIRDDTTVVYLCNPNNPTGTIFTGEALDGSSARSRRGCSSSSTRHITTSSRIPAYRSASRIAIERPNVVVLRTFTKVFGLASHRVGYAVGHPDTIAELRKTQIPFSVSQVAQTAATASLGDDAEHRRRVEANAVGRHHLLGVLEERGIAPYGESGQLRLLPPRRRLERGERRFHETRRDHSPHVPGMAPGHGGQRRGEPELRGRPRRSHRRISLGALGLIELLTSN